MIKNLILKASYQLFSDYPCRKSPSQQKLAKKITHFTIKFSSINLAHFAKFNSFNTIKKYTPATQLKTFLVGVRKNTCTAPFLDP